MEETSADEVTVHLPHHIQQELCTTRAPYRQGRKLTAVKVYTVNNESQHLLVYRVPAIKLQNELSSLCNNFGTVSSLNKLELTDPGEEFTDVYHVCYSRIREARRAKRGLDGRSFYGSPLHVCYAPELESIEETRLKLISRRNEIAYHTGRKMKVPKLTLKRPGIMSGLQQPPKKLKLKFFEGRAVAFNEPHVPGSSAALHGRYCQPSTSYGTNQGASVAPKENLVHQPSAAIYQGPPIPYLPGLRPENGHVTDNCDCNSEAPVAGPYDVSHFYPSQEVLKLPGQEVKQARDKKFMPSALIKNSTASTPNRIVFHKKTPELNSS